MYKWQQWQRDNTITSNNNQRIHVSKIFFTTIDNVIYLNASKIVFQGYTLFFFLIRFIPQFDFYYECIFKFVLNVYELTNSFSNSKKKIFAIQDSILRFTIANLHTWLWSSYKRIHLISIDKKNRTISFRIPNWLQFMWWMLNK